MKNRTNGNIDRGKEMREREGGNTARLKQELPPWAGAWELGRAPGKT